MVWPFTVECCLLCARELVRAVIRTPCCHVLVHKTCLYAALAITPSRPTPTCPHCRQALGLACFRRLCWRLSGKWSPWFECPLAPMSPHAHSYHGVYLQSMDPPPPSSAGPPDDHDERVSGTHRLICSRAPLPPSPSRVPCLPSSYLPLFVPLRGHHDHHHHDRHPAATPGHRR